MPAAECFARVEDGAAVSQSRRRLGAIGMSSQEELRLFFGDDQVRRVRRCLT